MRYLLTQEQIDEIPARCEYLYDIFGFYFYPQDTIDGFIPLVPLGTADPSFLFIIGHQNQVMHFLTSNIEQIPENNLVLITCLASTFKSFRNFKKNIFYSAEEKGLSYRYHGEDYGFNFDLTKSELDFYNSCEKDILKRIHLSFKHL